MGSGTHGPELTFSTSCRRCQRLAAHLSDIRNAHPAYYARPVPSFGPQGSLLLIVGLAPGLHGANRTGRPFTGDHAGLLLYRTLHRFGFADRSQSTSVDDGLRLIDCRITNAVRCVPPGNKPTGQEIGICNAYLREEIAYLPPAAAVLALGGIAHSAILRACALPLSRYPFAHAAAHPLPDALTLFDSYHCSRYNTQTGRLTEAMFTAVFTQIRRHLERSRAGFNGAAAP